MTNKNYTFDNMYEDVKAFNNLAGGKTSKDSFIAQVKCLVEEVNETVQGVEDNDVVAILDGAIDTIYVAMGILHKLEQLGVNIHKASNQVCENNLTKFPTSEYEATETVKFYNNTNVNVHYVFNHDYSKYVIKDENGKVRKPFNFIPTDLSSYVPEWLQVEGLK